VTTVVNLVSCATDPISLFYMALHNGSPPAVLGWASPIRTRVKGGPRHDRLAKFDGDQPNSSLLTLYSARPRVSLPPLAATNIKIIISIKHPVKLHVMYGFIEWIIRRRGSILAMIRPDYVVLNKIVPTHAILL